MARNGRTSEPEDRLPMGLEPSLGADAEVLPYEEAWADIEATLAASEPEHPTWQEAMAHSRGRAPRPPIV